MEQTRIGFPLCQVSWNGFGGIIEVVAIFVSIWFFRQLIIDFSDLRDGTPNLANRGMKTPQCPNAEVVANGHARIK